MKIKVQQLIGLWNGLNQVYKDNEKLDGAFDYFMQKQNLPILRKEVEKLQTLDDQTFQEIKSKTLELPLQSITPDMLPSQMTKGVTGLLDPIIEGTVDMSDYESQLDGLLEKAKEQTNGSE